MVTSEDSINRIIASIFNNMNNCPNKFTEIQTRWIAGCIADALGYGGIKQVCDLSKLNYRTVKTGKTEVNGEIVKELPDGKIRESGAGRPGIEKKYPDIHDKVEKILETNTYGDPEKIITWTNLSLRDIVKELEKQHKIETNKNVVADIMEELGYSRQVNQKNEQVGSKHVDRDSQFIFINEKSKRFINENTPVISVDTKKKELIGNFKNAGSEYRKAKQPRKVLDHDFPLEGGKVAPYGVYLINKNEGFVNLGTDHDTSAFAVESIRRWWNIVGKPTYPDSNKLYINCDGGGSNGWRSKLWKYELAMLAEELNVEIHVSHFPPGTSKWNKIEHRLFCFITKNWAGKPLIDINTTVNLIGSTKTEKGLKVKCVVDNNLYETGIKRTDDEMTNIDIVRDDINPNWNYVIKGFKNVNNLSTIP